MKITYIGDVTCDRPLLKALEPDYDFNIVFGKMKKKFQEADLVVANFETVCGGKALGYKNGHMRYNTPETIMEAMKLAGIHLVSTANNHCLDQGIDGLLKTLDYLDYYGICHVGTNRNNEESNRIVVKEVGKKRIAFLSYTYSTNEANTGIVLNTENDFYVNLLRKQSDISVSTKWWKRILFKILSGSQRQTLKRAVARTKQAFGIPFRFAFTDHIEKNDTDNWYLKKVSQDIKEAKKQADIVVLLIHAGGQFNETPGEYCDFLLEYLSGCGADLVVENHSHVVQKIAKKNGTLCAYSLGSFNMSLSAEYIIHEVLPQYSLALHQYIASDHIKYSFSILKNVEEKDGSVTVWPVKELYDSLESEEKQTILNEISIIYERIAGERETDLHVKDEYELPWECKL